ncbi:porin [Opitutus terrae]|uniref:Phosphate-selective porin O and P n=1 Tax=Opitutus terrae (strain DSM 11246 / JCM 15787 / PB90-1) TaxID=452637 RepID=B1ZU66_OPITP|nr:porin [Opitutus terrae]ACB76632.1 phosphate-selective porin O and P [Opitutus terrae PB90-1]
MHSSANSPAFRVRPAARAALLATAVITLGLAAPALAGATPDELETRLRALESKVATLTEENATLKQRLGASAPAKSGPAAVVPMGKEAKLAIGGFLHLQGEWGDAPDARFPVGDRFLVRRARLGVKGSFVEGFDFALTSDFGSNSLGTVSGYRAQITDAYVAWSRFPAATVTVGQFKTPFGYEQLMSGTKHIVIERALVNDQLTLRRQIGAMLSGSVGGPRLTYAAGLFNGNGSNNSANDNDQFTYVGRVAGTWIQTDAGRVSTGINAFTGRDSGSFSGHRRGLGVDLQASYRRLELQAEYLNTCFDRAIGRDYTAEGWSLLGSCVIIPKLLQGVLRYEVYDVDRDLAGDTTELWTVGFNYLIKGDDLKLSFNYLLGDLPGPRAEEGRLISRLQVVF